MFLWNENYVTGFHIIDEQHENIFSITKRVSDMANNLNATLSDVLSDVFEEMIAYTIYHFATEEEFWEKNHPEMLDGQRTDHQWFIDEVNAFELSKMETEKEGFVNDMLIKLTYWITNHVIQEIEDIKNMQF